MAHLPFLASHTEGKGKLAGWCKDVATSLSVDLLLQAMVRGPPKASKRAQIAAAKKLKTALTPEEQVDCLLDQATDAGILGRTWAGWRPFV